MQSSSVPLFSPPYTPNIVSRCLYLIGDLVLYIFNNNNNSLQKKFPLRIITTVQAFLAPSFTSSSNQPQYYYQIPPLIRSTSIITLSKICWFEIYFLI
jgi:hypothetical protein